MTKLLVISDTHFISKRQRLSERITRYYPEVDHVVHAGDYTHLSLVEHLESTGKFYGVAGNMDPPAIKKKLPEINEILLDEGVKVGIIHGWGAPHGIIERIHPIAVKNHFDVVIFGHTHNRLKKEYENVKYFNPGSPVDKVFAKENTFLILTINSKKECIAEFIKL
ncbi:MAG: metallophosphoesterase family protein [Promethearchaeota archaeon]